MIRFKKRGQKKGEEARKLPLVKSWTPELNANCVVTDESFGQIDEETSFGLDSFANPTLAYYLAPEDSVSYKIADYQVEPASLQVWTKGILKTWECEGKDCQGTVAYGGTSKEITEFEVHPDPRWTELRPGMVVQFTINKNRIIEQGSILRAKPIVTELPEDKRRRIKETFDKINEGGLAEQACPEIPTWKCIKCNKLNFAKWTQPSETTEKPEKLSRNKANQEIYQYTCRNPDCGAVRPQRQYVEIAQDEETSISTYKLLQNAPQFWNRQDVRKWKQSEEHTTLDEILNKAMRGYSPDHVKNTCPGCNEKITGSGSGCTRSIDDKRFPALSFSDFYKLDPETTQGQTRRKQLEDLLNQFPPCNCGLSAIPKAPCNVFREMKGHSQTDSARKHFENCKDEIFNEIISERLMKPGAILYPSIRRSARCRASRGCSATLSLFRQTAVSRRRATFGGGWRCAPCARTWTSCLPIGRAHRERTRTRPARRAAGALLNHSATSLPTKSGSSSAPES